MISLVFLLESDVILPLLWCTKPSLANEQNYKLSYIRTLGKACDVFCVCTTCTGLAFYQAICTQYSATIVREAGEYATTQIVTHELGHT